MVNAKLDRFDSALQTNVRKLEELDVFLRRLSVSQATVDSLMERCSDLVSTCAR